MEYLDFEDSIKQLVDKIVETKKINNEDNKIDLTDTIKNLENELKKKRKEIYANLNAWQKVQLSRHPQRPYSMDYIKALTKSLAWSPYPLRDVTGAVTNNSFFVVCVLIK